jgi:uracil-DNA glycosylase
MHIPEIRDFDHWRQVARTLRQANAAPTDIVWESGGQQSLFDAPLAMEQHIDASAEAADSPPNAVQLLHVPREFIELAREVSCHRQPQRWKWLYEALWRLTTTEPHLLELSTDETVFRLHMLEKAVRRDAHKMKAFVRFKQIESEGETRYVAWHRPDHLVVRKVAPFFSRRFKAMHWTILTPDESVSWDQVRLTYGPGAPRIAAPQHDELEEMWRTYYANIFNPARIKVQMMKAEMPTRHWPTLPEAQIIDSLLRDAPHRVAQMIDQSEGYATSAADYFPAGRAAFDLTALREAASTCQGCDLHQPATQTVFGKGPVDSRLVLVGEQPGDQEDVAGEPFVGPAGQLLDEALAEAGIRREEVYVTNVVKHFKFELQGKRRLHKRPNAREIRACRPWFQAEWNALTPSAADPLLANNERTLVCLGATAAQALISPEFRIQAGRGQWQDSPFTARTLATWHPASILRLPDESLRQRRFQELVSDLKKANLG